MSPRACVLFILFQLWTTDGRHNSKRHAGPSDPIVFPGPVKKVPTIEAPNDIEVPEECKHKTYCHIRPKNYPQHVFDNMFRGKKIPSQPELVLPPDISDRFSDEESDGCQAEITNEPIYMVNDGETGWRTVVQAPKYNYTQRIRLEKCSLWKEPFVITSESDTSLTTQNKPQDEDSSCFSVFPKVPDYTAFCKQKYGVWEVLVSDKTSTQPIKTELPICCSCYYKQTEKQ